MGPQQLQGVADVQRCRFQANVTFSQVDSLTAADAPIVQKVKGHRGMRRLEREAEITPDIITTISIILSPWRHLVILFSSRSVIKGFIIRYLQVSMSTSQGCTLWGGAN